MVRADMTMPGRAVASILLLLASIRVSHGCGAVASGGSGACKAESVDGVFWHREGADFGSCEADVRKKLYHGDICFEYSDASQQNNFCMLDNSHVYYWESGRDDPNSQVHFFFKSFTFVKLFTYVQ